MLLELGPVAVEKDVHGRLPLDDQPQLYERQAMEPLEALPVLPEGHQEGGRGSRPGRPLRVPRRRSVRIELPKEAFDLAILESVCHLFGPGDNRRMLLRLFRALRAGGTVAVIDSLRDGTDQREQAIYGLGLLLRAPEGDVYPALQLSGVLLRAGFEAVEDVLLTERPPLTLVRARRPPAGTLSSSNPSGRRTAQGRR